jgi:drug/metabolite transporter (DMT)-like permease
MLWVVYALASAICLSAGSLLGKHVLKREHALEYGATQGFIALLLVFTLPFIKLDYSWSIYASLFIISIVLAAGNLYYLRSIRHSELSSTMPLMNLSPLFLLALAFTLLGETPTLIDVGGVLLLVAGTYVVQLSQMNPEAKKGGFFEPFKVLMGSRYALYMIFAVLVLSFASVMIKAVAIKGIDALSLLVILRLFLGLDYVVLEAAQHGIKEIFQDVRKDGLPIVGSTLMSIAGDFFFILAVLVPGALVSLIVPVQRTSTLLTSLAGGHLFKESGIRMKIFGCLIMILGVVVIAVL